MKNSENILSSWLPAPKESSSGNPSLESLKKLRLGLEENRLKKELRQTLKLQQNQILTKPLLKCLVENPLKLLLQFKIKEMVKVCWIFWEEVLQVKDQLIIVNH